MLQNKTLLLLLFLVLLNCKEDKKNTAQTPINQNTLVALKYAEGFAIKDFGTYKLLEIKNPWPNAEDTFKYTLANYGDDRQADNTITLPIKRIVVTSTTHIPSLELLEVEQTLVGFPGTHYVSSTKTRALIDNGNIRELGKNEAINTEVLLELNPDLVIGFGIDGNNKTFNTIQRAGIPVIFNGDWVEQSPLAKAEWIKFFGVLYNKQKEADSIFNTIEKEYLSAKAIAAKVEKQPTVLSGAMHKDIWYLPNGTSPEAQILKDANANYLWSDTTNKGSLALNFETVFDKAKEANLWLSPSYYPSFEALEKANQHYTKFDAFKTKNIYTFANTTGSTGGVTYYELGTARPDLVLKDIIKICHPELLPDYKPHFFAKLK